ncbi:ribonuclease domain-containing protein [Streptomyces sp. NPDC059835]|uniref:ribonuclease domain-containing protein n=1 Tax=Streptomyces sp. NPDC059835 TaxID=3346967 RepID=UPI00365D95F6
MILRTAPRSFLRLLGALFLGAALVGGTMGCGGPNAAPAAVTGSAAPAPSWAKGLATVRADVLPQQARDVLVLIDKGGPYPYRQDGAVFGNFEKALPKQKRGYYHEFTVKTPGEPDRGARRIVTGQGGEFYYTDDHYDTFKAVLR